MDSFKIKINQDSIHIPLSRACRSILRKESCFGRTWFNGTSQSQLARGIYYFARNLVRKREAVTRRDALYTEQLSRENPAGAGHDQAEKRKFRSRNFRWLLFHLSLSLSHFFPFRVPSASTPHSSAGNVRQLRRFTADSDSSNGRISKIETRQSFVLHIEECSCDHEHATIDSAAILPNWKFNENLCRILSTSKVKQFAKWILN